MAISAIIKLQFKLLEKEATSSKVVYKASVFFFFKSKLVYLEKQVVYLNITFCFAQRPNVSPSKVSENGIVLKFVRLIFYHIHTNLCTLPFLKILPI